MSDVVAIIPARGGSKGLPRKNLAPLGARPLMAWTIAAAQAAACVDRVIVSTDDEEIAAVARDCGAETPFLRPSDLAADDTPGVAPIEHAVRWLADRDGYRAPFAACLQPTSPLRTAEDIDRAFGQLRAGQADAVVSVAPVEENPYWMKTIGEDGRLENLFPASAMPTRRQDLPPVYALNGAIYIVRCAVLLDRHTLFPPNTVGYIMPRSRSIDIDSQEDLDRAGAGLRRSEATS